MISSALAEALATAGQDTAGRLVALPSDVALRWHTGSLADGPAGRNVAAPRRRCPQVTGGASAYRIIQEAVTSVARHARTGQCQVSISQQDGRLPIEVTDTGCGGSAAGTGSRIAGMRERAALLGGHFSAGPRPGGGFRVAAPLPVPASAR